MKYAILGLLIFLIALPLVIGMAAASDSFVFNGFIINIPDNYSYIGKMREGWLGSWQFSMLSSSIPPGKNYLYLFYIFLGHVARWLGLPLILTFHAARGLAVILLWYQLCRFVDVYLERHDAKTKNTASFITNLVVISSTIKEIGKHNPDLFYPVSMQTAFGWMLVNRPSENVVLAAPRTGAFIPGETGWRVVYGHHVETPDAYNTQLTLEQIFYGMKSTDEIMEYIETIGADYVFIGPLERKFGGELTWVNRFPVVYENVEVAIYRTGVDS